MVKSIFATKRWIGLALALALAMGAASAGQPRPAQAAPAGDYSYRVVAAFDKGKATICVGDVVTAGVRVVMFQDDKQLGPIRSSMWVEGSVQNPGIGKFVMARKPIGWNSDRPREVVFAFRALKAGQTTLTFKAEVHYYKSVVLKWIYGPVEYVNSDPLAVTVVNCKYRVSTVSIWKMPGEMYTAVMPWTDLTADANGNFTGQGTATWNGFWQVVPAGSGAGVSCATTLTAPPSPVDLTGQLNQAGNMVVTINFHDVAAPSWHVVCSGNGGAAPPIDRSFRLAAETLTVLLPPAGAGSFRQTQTLIDAATGFGRTFVFPVAKP